MQAQAIEAIRNEVILPALYAGSRPVMKSLQAEITWMEFPLNRRNR